MPPTGEQLSYTDAYARSVVARVRGIEAGETPLLILDRTVFYPGGGGQPADRGHAPACFRRPHLDRHLGAQDRRGDRPRSSN